MRRIQVGLILSVLMLGFQGMAKDCDPAKSKPCGKTCISLSKECKMAPEKKCGENSKPCGKSCISKEKECHK